MHESDKCYRISDTSTCRTQQGRIKGSVSFSGRVGSQGAEGFHSRGETLLNRCFLGRRLGDSVPSSVWEKCSSIQYGDELSLRWGLHAAWHIDAQTKVNRIPAPPGSCLCASRVCASPEVMYIPYVYVLPRGFLGADPEFHPIVPKCCMAYERLKPLLTEWVR